MKCFFNCFVVTMFIHFPLSMKCPSIKCLSIKCPNAVYFLPSLRLICDYVLTSESKKRMSCILKPTLSDSGAIHLTGSNLLPSVL